MACLDPGKDATGVVDDVDGVTGAALVKSGKQWHGMGFSGWIRLPEPGKSCGVLIGALAASTHASPVVRLGLATRAEQLVSWGRQTARALGRRGKCSGRADAPPLRSFASANPKVHQ